MASFAPFVVAAASASQGSHKVGERLPDLDQEAPSGLMMAVVGKRYVLGFESRVQNVGDGPLVIQGHRSSHARPTMTTTQLIERADGGQDRVRTPGRLKYAVSPDHQHWHLLHFDRYELRRAGGGRVLARDRKTGFCLGDRYRVTSPSMPNAPGKPVWTDRCGLTKPWLLGVREGISVGYGDNYTPYLEGQSLTLTGLPAGRYVLVHRVNEERALRELGYRNDAASVLLDLRWHGKRPSMRLLATCADSARCEAKLGAARAGTARPVPFGTVSINWTRAGRRGAHWALCGAWAPK